DRADLGDQVRGNPHAARVLHDQIGARGVVDAVHLVVGDERLDPRQPAADLLQHADGFLRDHAQLDRRQLSRAGDLSFDHVSRHRLLLLATLRAIFGVVQRMPPKSRKEEYAEATRAALVDVARALFGEKGFAAVSIEEIVQGARVTRGALYHHFEDKQAL